MSSKITDQATETRSTRASATSSLGAQLRSAREAQNVTLRQISEQTRIQMRYLEAIEADNFQQLPGGIFNRSFIKAYARQVGFNEDEALEAYARTAREQGTPSDEEMPTSYQPRVYTNGDSTRSPLVNSVFALLIVGIISVGVYALQHWYNRRSATEAAVATAAPTVAPQPTPTAPPVAQNLGVQIRAVGENVWLQAGMDDLPASRFELKPSDTPRDYTPQNRLSLRYAKAKAQALEVTINGRRARVPAEGATTTVEMLITPDNYQQLLQ